MGMRNILKTILCVAVVSLIGAADAAVSVDFDKEADFSGYKTFAWKEGTLAQSTLMHKRIVRSIEAQLESVGLTKTEDEPDVYVLYHVALKQDRRISVDDFGYSHRWRGPHYGGGDVTVFDVNVGTLIVDMLDAGSEEGVWRGMAQRDLPPTPNPDKMEKKLVKVLGKMFRDYPPE